MTLMCFDVFMWIYNCVVVPAQPIYRSGSYCSQRTASCNTYSAPGHIGPSKTSFYNKSGQCQWCSTASGHKWNMFDFTCFAFPDVLGCIVVVVQSVKKSPARYKVGINNVAAMTYVQQNRQRCFVFYCLSYFLTYLCDSHNQHSGYVCTCIANKLLDIL